MRWGRMVRRQAASTTNRTSEFGSTASTKCVWVCHAGCVGGWVCHAGCVGGWVCHTSCACEARIMEAPAGCQAACRGICKCFLTLCSSPLREAGRATPLSDVEGWRLLLPTAALANHHKAAAQTHQRSNYSQPKPVPQVEIKVLGICLHRRFWGVCLYFF